MNQGLQSILSLLLVTLLILSGCKDAEPAKEATPTYAFATAGHAYGKTGVDNDGLHPPLEAKFPFLNDLGNVDLCFLTGDVVILCTEKNWHEVDSVLENLDAEVHIAPGNHDLTNVDLYEELRGPRYYNFKHKGDLYVVLEPYSKGWKISGGQKEMLLTALEEHKDSNKFTFIFFHHPIWYEEDNKYNVCVPNSTHNKQGESNFFPEIVPILKEMSNDVAIYAGDLGIHLDRCSVMYDHFDNIHLIASGMGGGAIDNMILTKIYGTDSIGFELIALQNEPNSMGTLSDYWIK